MRWVRAFVVTFMLTLILGGTFLGGYVLGGHRAQPAGAEAPGFELLWQVQNLLDRDFMGDIPPVQAQAYGAVRGLVETYKDPYTVFLEPGPREVERDELRGQFGGIGAYLGRNDAGEMVVTVMRDLPAARSGVRDGDILLAVDGKPVSAEMTVDQVVALIRGDIGTKVVLTLRRPDRAEPFDIALVRERIETPSVEWRVLDKAQHVGYARIRLFTERSGQELQTGLAELRDQGVDRLILDLRGNGGGLLDAAVDTASLFLRGGEVLRELKRGGQERFFPVKPANSPAQDWEIALLVDKGTASASEIVAGALRDQGRAVLIGEKTFGKGSVQEVNELPDGSSLHITVARWLTPNRHQIDKSGLDPDIAVGISAEDRSAGRDPQLARAEAWLQGQR